MFLDQKDIKININQDLPLNFETKKLNNISLNYNEKYLFLV